MGKKENYVDLFYKELSKSCDPKDYWGQVKRSVDGKPVSNDHILLIVDAVNKGLQFRESDVLLDIGCGNGALSAFFIDKVKRIIGVDFSEFLISVAKKDFEVKPDYMFHLSDALDFVINYDPKEEITKALCYGTFAYFDLRVAEEMLRRLNEEYKNLSKFYIGNLPDKDRASDFFYENVDFSDQINDSTSPIGIWRNESEMKELANKTGWDAEFFRMPKIFQGSHYRYDVLLKRKL